MNILIMLKFSIVDFGPGPLISHPVTIISSGSTIAGETYSLNCSAILFDPIPLPSDVPSPNFQWFYGPNGSASLHSGLTPPTTVMSSSNSTSCTYTSALQFSPLNQSHAGNYTCRLGAGRLVNSAMVTVDGM